MIVSTDPIRCQREYASSTTPLLPMRRSRPSCTSQPARRYHEGGKIPGRPEGQSLPAISAQMPALSVTVQSFSENNPWPTWRRGGFATRLPGAASFSSLAKVPRRVHLLESEQLPLSRGFDGSPGSPGSMGL